MAEQVEAQGSPGTAASPQSSSSPLPAPSLHQAVEAGDIEAVRNLLEAHVDINARDHLDRTPLKVASASGKVAITQLLLLSGAKLGDGDEVGVRPRLAHALSWKRGRP